jgi:hypothetical protein
LVLQQAAAASRASALVSHTNAHGVSGCPLHSAYDEEEGNAMAIIAHKTAITIPVLGSNVLKILLMKPPDTNKKTLKSVACC